MSAGALRKLGIGTAALGLPYGIGAQKLGHESAAVLLRDALSAGIRYVDTAAAYGDAESVIGRVGAALHAGDVRVCTKVTIPTLRTHGACAALRESLARMGLASVDTVMLHSADSAALADTGHAAELEQLVAGGLAKRIGASTYGSPDAKRALSLGWVRALQVEHSVLNPSVVRALGASATGVEVVARSVLCKGLLTTRRAQAGAVAASLGKTLDALDSFAADLGLDLPGLAIRYALDSPGVDLVLVGVASGEELDVALRAANRAPLTPADLRELATFDRSHDDASHPELWPAQSAGGAAS